MNVTALVPHIAFESIFETLKKLNHYHLSCFKQGEFKDVCPARLFLKTGRCLEGFIVDFNDTTIVMVTSQNLVDENLRVTQTSVSAIEGVELDQFEKVFDLFNDKKMQIGIGEIPTMLSIKKMIALLSDEPKNSHLLNIEMSVDYDGFKANDKGIWALHQFTSNLSKFVQLDGVDEDFVSAFSEAIDKIKIVPDLHQQISLNRRILTITVNITKGLQGVPSEKMLYDYLVEQL